MTAPVTPSSRHYHVGPVHASVRGLVGLALTLHGLIAVASLPLSFTQMAVGLTLIGTAVTRTCPFCALFRRVLGWDHDPER